MEGGVAYERHGVVATLTFTEGDRGNPLHPASLSALLDAVRQARAEAARVIVLRSTGRMFCVGGDLDSFSQAKDMSTFVDDLAESLHRIVSELIHGDAVVVSVVQGAAAGAGLSLVAASDIVIAAENATFTLAYSAVGLSNDGGSSLLAHSIGMHRMLRMALLNDRLTAREAMNAGLVARVAASEHLDAVADEVVGALAAGPSLALAACKRLIRDVAEPSPEAVMRRETLAIRTAATQEAPEGIRAFLEKRPPAWSAEQDLSRTEGGPA